MIVEMKVNIVTEFKAGLSIRTAKSKTEFPYVKYVSKLERAINVIGYMYHYINNLKAKCNEANSEKRSKRGKFDEIAPTASEKALVLQHLIKKAQQQSYLREITALRLGKALPEKSTIEALKPILDKREILRVGGRLDRAEID